MKIAFCYLGVTNLGDIVIADTARYVTGLVLRELGRDDVEIVPVDIGLEGATLGGRLGRGFVKSMVGLARGVVRGMKRCIPGTWFLR